jgi:hypothetical protein
MPERVRIRDRAVELPPQPHRRGSPEVGLKAGGVDRPCGVASAVNPPKTRLPGKGASLPAVGEGGCPFEPGRVRDGLALRALMAVHPRQPAQSDLAPEWRWLLLNPCIRNPFWCKARRVGEVRFQITGRGHAGAHRESRLMTPEQPPIEYPYSKARLPKGESFPLKRGEVDTLLASVKPLRLHAVYFARGRDRFAMSAYFSPDCSRGAAAGRTTLMVHSIPSALRRDVREALLAGGAQRLIHWLEACETAAETWRLHGHHISVTYTSHAGVLNFECDDYGPP